MELSPEVLVGRSRTHWVEIVTAATWELHDS